MFICKSSFAHLCYWRITPWQLLGKPGLSTSHPQIFTLGRPQSSFSPVKTLKSLGAWVAKGLNSQNFVAHINSKIWEQS